MLALRDWALQNRPSMMNEWIQLLAGYGITPVVLLGGVGTIVASFFSARWGAAESRRQFAVKESNNKKFAAMTMIPPLLVFASECDRRKGSLSLFISSSGQEGSDESMARLLLDQKIQIGASSLSPIIAVKAIKLSILKDRCTAFLNDNAPFDDRDILDEKLLSFFALLSLRARYLADLVAKDTELSAAHPPEDLERLLKEAQKHGYEVDSGDEDHWY